MMRGLLMELDDHNRWTIAEAAGRRRGPRRLQHLLSRAVWDDQQVLDIALAWEVSHLDDRDAVLIVGVTADEKSSPTALAQPANTAAPWAGRVVPSGGHADLRHIPWPRLDRPGLYLPEGCAADEEHRELAGGPGGRHVCHQAAAGRRLAWLDRAHALGIRAAFAAGDEVYGGRQLRRSIRQCGMGYVLAVRASHVLLAYLYLAVAVAVAVQRQYDAVPGQDAGLIPVTVPELLRLLRGTVIPPPRRDRAHGLRWSAWRRRHQYRARQAHRRWNAYAEKTP